MSSMSQLLMLLWCVVRTAGVWQERCRNVIVVPFRRAISHRNLCWAQPAHQKIIPDFLKIFFFILWPVVIYHDDCLLKTCDVAQDTKSTWKHAESARARLHACKVSYVWLLCMRLDAKCKCLTYESESSWVLFASTPVCVFVRYEWTCRFCVPVCLSHTLPHIKIYIQAGTHARP